MSEGDEEEEDAGFGSIMASAPNAGLGGEGRTHLSITMSHRLFLKLPSQRLMMAGNLQQKLEISWKGVSI